MNARPTLRFPLPPRRVEVRIGPVLSEIGFWGLQLSTGIGALVACTFGFRNEGVISLGGGALGLLWNGVALWAIWTILKEHRYMKRLHTQGQESIGTLLRKRIEGNEGDERYLVTYEFEDNAGRKHTTQDERVEQSLWESLREAQEVSVLFDSENPARNHLYIGRIYRIQLA